MLPGEHAELVARLDRIDAQLNLVHTALTGNPTIGHRGLIERIELIETLHAEVPAVHADIKEVAKEGDRRLHSRIDDLAHETRRFRYIVSGAAIGAGAVSGGVGAWLTRFLG